MQTRRLGSVLLALVLGVLRVQAQVSSDWQRQTAGSPSEHTCTLGGVLSTAQFQGVMQTIAEGWNRGDAKRAASCFAENAIYSAPPSFGHHGRQALYEFFGGANGRKLPMRMSWHNLIFDPVQQIGVGEYTFRYRKQTHGLVIVRLANGLITNWREYEVESELPWDQFIKDNRF